MVSKKSKKSLTEDSNKSSSASDALLDQIANFYILPIHMPAVTTSSATSSSSHISATYKNVLHYLYFKKHESPKEDSKTPKNRTLFVLNLPIDSTEAHIRELFKPYGRVISVYFINKIRDNNNNMTEMTREEREQQEELERLEQEAEALENAKNESKKKGKKGASTSTSGSGLGAGAQNGSDKITHRRLLTTGAQAYVVFLEEQEVTKVLNMKKKKRTWIGDDVSKLSTLGVAKWINDYHRMRPDHASLQAKVDEYMDKFERSEYEAEQAALARLNAMDEDGFTLVTSAGNKGYNTDGVIRVQAIKSEDAKKIKPKKKELQDFYRFQMREAKRDKLVELRRKFEEDKIRIEALKANKRFKPY